MAGTGAGGEGTPVAAPPAMALSLAGAYHPEGQPLVQRRITVETALPLAVLFGEAEIGALVSAEDLATRSPASGVARVVRAVRGDDRASEFSADLSFTGDDGRHYVLALSAPLAWRGIRALTEVAGELTRVPGARVGPVTLRLDWRSIFRGA